MKNPIFLFILFSFSFFSEAQNLQLFEQSSFKSKYDAVEYMVFNPSGTRLASAGDNQTVYIWNTTNNTLDVELIGHQGRINHLIYNKSGDKILSASNDGTAILWDAKTGIQLHHFTFAGKSSSFKDVNFAIFSPDERYVYLGGKNHKIVQFDLKEIDAPKILHTSLYVVTCAVNSPDGRNMVVGSGKQLIFLNPKTQKVENSIKDFDNWVNDVVFNHSGDQLAVWTEDGLIHIWSYPNMKKLATLKAGDKGYSHLSYSFDDKYLASGNIGNSIRLWDTKLFHVAMSGTTHTAKVCALQFSPLKPTLMSGSYDGRIKTWTIGEKPQPKPKPVPTPQPHPEVTEEEIPVITIDTKIVNDRKFISKKVVKVKSDVIDLEVWDDETIDGDVISLYYNDQPILENYELKKKKKTLKLLVPANSTNYLVLYAHNIGIKPPNTAAISIYDGNLRRKINLSSNLEESGAITIERE